MSRTQGSAVERARRDIAAGEPWKARDRLTAAARANSGNQEVFELLGEVHYLMGDLPAAGRYWLPTERRGEDVDKALAAFEQRWGGSIGEKLKQVPVRGAIDEYPPLARDRLRPLSEEAERAGIDWPLPRRTAARPQGDFDDEIDVGREGWVYLGLLLVVGPGLWLLGIVAVVYLLVCLFT